MKKKMNNNDQPANVFLLVVVVFLFIIRIITLFRSLAPPFPLRPPALYCLDKLSWLKK